MSKIISSNSQALIGKWAKRIGITEKVQGKPLSMEKKIVLAQMLENQSDRIKAFEATNPGQIGAFKRYALDLVQATVPNLIANDIVAVQAMDNRVGMVNYIDFQYQSAKGEVAKDQVFNSSRKGSFSDPDYTSSYVNGEKHTGDGSTTVFNLAWTPVDTRTTNPHTGEVLTPVVTVGGTAQVVDTDFTVSPTGITFKTGSIPADGAEIVVKYYFMNEEVRSDGYGAFGGPTNGNQSVDGALGAAGFTNVPEIGLKLNTLPVEAKARTLRAYWAFDAKLVA